MVLGPKVQRRGPEGPPKPTAGARKRGAVGTRNFLVYKMSITQMPSRYTFSLPKTLKATFLRYLIILIVIMMSDYTLSALHWF